jgi:hypothetical protein
VATLSFFLFYFGPMELAVAANGKEQERRVDRSKIMLIRIYI